MNCATKNVINVDVEMDGRIEPQKFWRIPSRLERHERPFFWNSQNSPGFAPTGWYQWTATGLRYLGESILEEA
jgi:hypothetical protein